MDWVIFDLALLVSVIAGLFTILYFLLAPYKGWKDDD